MINCSSKLQFLKTDGELENTIHDSIDETIKLIFEHNNPPKNITPSHVNSKSNSELCFYKFFSNHRASSRVKFDENWCTNLFDISKEKQEDYCKLQVLHLLLPATEINNTVTKTLYKKTKSWLRLFFYILWANKAVLLPFNYKPPKARDSKNNAWVEIGLPIYPETLRLIRNSYFKDKRFEHLNDNYISSTYSRDMSYQCIISTTWYTLEDIELSDAKRFKQFHLNYLRNENFTNKHKTLPFSPLLKSFLSYAPTRCKFQIQDLAQLEITRDETSHQKLNGFEIEVSTPFKFTANFSPKISFILKGDALRSNVKNSLNKTFDVILSRHYNKPVQLDTHGNFRDFKTTRLVFIYVFEKTKFLNITDLAYLYELMSHDYIAEYDIERFIHKDKITDFWKIEYSDNFKSGLKVFFIELYIAGAILLPMDYALPNTVGKNYSEVRYPELLNLFCNYKQHFTSEDLSKIRHVGTLYRAIIACNWRKVEDINLNDALEYQKTFQQRKEINPKNLTLQLWDLLFLVAIYAPDRINYRIEELHLALGDLPANYLLNSSKSDEFIHNSKDKWIQLTKQYLSEKAASGYKSIQTLQGNLGKFINYIYVDLPRVIEENSNLIPYNPNQLTRRHLIGDWKLPSIKEKLRKSVNNETYNTHLRELNRFFNWILLYGNDDPDIAGFINPILDLDFIRSSRRKGTDKIAFPRSQFSHIHSFTSAVCEFYWYLITENKFVSGGCTSRYCYDTQEVGYVPLVLIGGVFHPIYFIPSNLTHEITSSKNDSLYTYPVFQTLFENLIALETGLRHKHIRWLDREKFDVSTQHQKTTPKQEHIGKLQVKYAAQSESDEIEVATDKVKNEPWKPYVSSRVLNLLRRLKAFQDTLDIDVPSLWYDKHENSVFGKIKSLFSSMDATVELPPVITESACRKQYKRLLFFYDLFVQLSGLDIPLLGITSDESLQKMEDARKIIKDQQKQNLNLDDRGLSFLLWKYATQEAFYYNGKYTTHFKPHGTRASVASEKIKILPPQAIQDYVTGQESRAVLSYYIQVDPEWLTEIGDYNKNIFLTPEHLRKTQNSQLTIRQLTRVKEQLKAVVEQDPTLLGRDFGAISYSTEGSRGEIISGLNTIAVTPTSNCSFMPTHICPFGGMCPEDIKKEFGEFQCGQCYFSVKTVDHIPRILAHIRKLNDNLREKIEGINLTKAAAADKDALEVMEQEKNRIGNEEAAWVYTYEMLKANLGALKERCTNGSENFFVGRPDLLMQHYAEGELENNPLNALLLRIQDASAFKEYFTPQLKAQIIQIRNKILIHQERFEQILKQPDGYELIDEFRGILRAFTETYNVSLKDAAKLLAEPLKSPNEHLNLLEELNG